MMHARVIDPDDAEETWNDVAGPRLRDLAR